MNKAWKGLLDLFKERGFLPRDVDVQGLSEDEAMEVMKGALDSYASFTSVMSGSERLYRLFFDENRIELPRVAVEIRKIFNGSQSIVFTRDEKDFTAIIDGEPGDVKDIVNDIKLRFQVIETERVVQFRNDDKFILLFPAFTDKVMTNIFAVVKERPFTEDDRRLGIGLRLLISAALEKKKYITLLSGDQRSRIAFERKINEYETFMKNKDKFLMISQLVVGINHELNNPLAIIKGALYFLKKSLDGGHDPAMMEKNINRIDEAVETISTTIRKLENAKDRYHIKEYLDDISMVDINSLKEEDYD